jgi:serine/threonine-protein kinase
MSASTGRSSAFYDTVLQALSGEYAVERELGGGGMSRVFLAEERALRRRVAIKFLPPELAVELSLERFVREIRFAARLQQANIIPVLRAGKVDEYPYYTMPFVEGRSLRERLATDGTISIGSALSILSDITKALAYAHSHGVVHRDIKPANVLLSGGTAVVIDFGIAKAMLHASVAASAVAPLTQIGIGVGTPAYMAPEQAAADPVTDHRADLYSWGVLAYELLCGVHPFVGWSGPHRLIVAHLTVPPTPAQMVRPEIPPIIAQLVMQCLEKDPNNRPQSADVLLRTFDAYHMVARSNDVRPVYDSIAVLPFANIGSNADDEYLADGMSDDLIHALAKLGGLRVAARTSSFAFKGRTEDVRAIGASLGVECVLEGSVRRMNGQLRVMARLVDTQHGFEFWSQRYDREITDVFALQDDLSHAIAAALRLELLRTTPSLPAPTSNIAAYDLYLKARFHWNNRTEEALLRSLRYFEEALNADPKFALAISGQAAAYVMLAIYGALSPSDAMRNARDAADRALAIAPNSGEALAVRGSVRALADFDWPGAEDDFLRAVDADPQSSTPYHWYAMHCLIPMQRFSEAAPLLARARALDPLSPAIAASVGILRYFQRNYVEADRVFADVLKRHPHFALALYFSGQTSTQVGDYSRAIDALTHASSLTRSSPEIVSALGFAQGRSGDALSARESLARLQAAARQRYISPVNMAQIYVALGDRDAAIAELQRGVQLGAAELAFVGIRPTFDALHDMPAFTAIVGATREALV